MLRNGDGHHPCRLGSDQTVERIFQGQAVDRIHMQPTGCFEVDRRMGFTVLFKLGRVDLAEIVVKPEFIEKGIDKLHVR